MNFATRVSSKREEVLGAQHNLKNRVFKDSKDLGLRIN
jgi:hypothetical protein